MKLVMAWLVGMVVAETTGALFGGLCREGEEEWWCGGGDGGEEQCCAQATDEDSGGAWRGCLPCSLLHGLGHGLNSSCRLLHYWRSVQPDMPELLPHPLNGKYTASPRSVFSVRPAAAADEDTDEEGGVESESVCPVESFFALNGVEDWEMECPAGVGCCVEWRQGDGVWKGQRVGLGCESCDVGVGEWDWVRWRGGGGGQLLPPVWSDEGTMVCLWRMQKRCWRTATERGAVTTVPEVCRRGVSCCGLSGDGEPLGCLNCPPALGCRLVRDREVCVCEGSLCNARIPKAPPLAVGRPGPPPHDGWPTPAHHGHLSPPHAEPSTQPPQDSEAPIGSVRHAVLVVEDTAAGRFEEIVQGAAARVAAEAREEEAALAGATADLPATASTAGPTNAALPPPSLLFPATFLIATARFFL